MFKFERFNFEVIIPRCAGFVNTETAFFVRRVRGAGNAGNYGGCGRGAAVTERRGEWGTAEIMGEAEIVGETADVIRVSGRGCFR